MTAKSGKQRSTNNRKKTVSPRKPNGGQGARGYAEKKITKLEKANPHAEGSFRAKSWDKVKNGMKYADAVKAGARAVDIRFDLKNGLIKLS
jgi:hypothetical protein